jgi:hypothetical protein
MSTASALLMQGFRSLLATNGESLNFRSGFVNAVVDRDPFADSAKSPYFDPRDKSQIRLTDFATTDIPRVGEEFVDAAGMGHRVQTTQRIGDYVSMRCLVSLPNPDLLATEAGILITTEDNDPIQLG